MDPLPAAIGPYRVIRQLGEGGMGAVYEAIHETIERKVAIKVLHPQYAHHKDIAARFVNEARAVNRISHPGLVQVSDFGYLPTGAGYIVMEFLQGESLAQRLKRNGGQLDPTDAVYLATQIADALAAAHDKGVIHRDLKPDNIMIVADPQTSTGERTKILDFGIAKVTEEANLPGLKTKTNAMMGTPTYMSPEQCAGAGSVNVKTDVYALGVILFEMLAGKPPFVADGLGLIISMHLSVPPPRLRDAAPSVPAPLAEFIGRLLIKARDERPSMHEVHHRLEVIAQKLPPPRRPPDAASTLFIAGKGSAAPLDQRSTLGLAAAQAGQRQGWQKVVVMSAGGLMLAGLSVAVFLFLTQSWHAEVSQERKQHPIAERTGENSKPAAATSPASPKPSVLAGVPAAPESVMPSKRDDPRSVPKPIRPPAEKKTAEPVKRIPPSRTVPTASMRISPSAPRLERSVASPQIHRPSKPVAPSTKSKSNEIPIID